MHLAVAMTEIDVIEKVIDPWGDELPFSQLDHAIQQPSRPVLERPEFLTELAR